MKEKVLHPSRRGFTIIELLVVIGILGILLAALLPMVGGSRDSALNAKCQNNMKNLALGAITCAQGNAEGHFPSAGLYRSLDPTQTKKPYIPQRPWISNNGNPKTLNEQQSSPEVGSVVQFSGADDAVRMALTNGAIWYAAGSSYEVYRCPVHAREYEKKHHRQPGWSYAMNQEFGFNRNGKQKMPFFGSSINGSIHVATDSGGTRGTKDHPKDAWRGHDKVLLFAEIQGIDVNAKGVALKAVTSGSKADAVLEYTQENIGFNHPIGKKRYGGNVAFADGHVDTIVMPSNSGYISRLTRYLCQGFDVPHDGSTTYNPQAVDE